MDDTIYRQAAIRWVKTECNPYGNPTLDFESGKKVIEHLEQMPSAQPEPQWIPVSERLPEVGKDVMICYDFKGHRSVLIGVLYGDENFTDMMTSILLQKGASIEKP